MFLSALQTLNQLLAAGIAITAFSLLLYALSFNLRDRVARSFVIILMCVVVVFVGEALGSVAPTAAQREFWLRGQWLGIVFLPAAYLHISDALLETTGRPSRGRRRAAVRIGYGLSFFFLLTLLPGWLVGPLTQNDLPASHLARTPLTWVFTAYYFALMGLTWINFWRARRRTVASSTRRRMNYLMAGALAPALGSYPFLLFGAGVAARFPTLFWLVVTAGNAVVLFLFVLMAYAVAFFGVSWPDRVVKRRLFKWLMRGPVTASTVLALTTIVRRAGQALGRDTSAVAPVLMVAAILIFEHLITLLAPIWERWLFHGGDRSEIDLLQTLEERLLTLGDLQQLLEAILAAVLDRLQAKEAFLAAIGPSGIDLFVNVGGADPPEHESLSVAALEGMVQHGLEQELFVWGKYWVIPLLEQIPAEAPAPSPHPPELLGLLGVERPAGAELDPEQAEALVILTERAALALADRRRQEQVFSSLEALTPQMDFVQRLRAASRYDGSEVLSTPSLALEDRKLSQWVKDALNHYWGGPKLTQSPLLDLQIVRKALHAHEDNPTNALRAVLRQAMEQIKPPGERRFTAEWILYNILEMKFFEGRKVREIALRLAMSEADLYRKQRVAIEAMAAAIAEMEQQERQDQTASQDADHSSAARA